MISRCKSRLAVLFGTRWGGEEGDFPSTTINKELPLHCSRVIMSPSCRYYGRTVFLCSSRVYAYNHPWWRCCQDEEEIFTLQTPICNRHVKKGSEKSGVYILCVQSNDIFSRYSSQYPLFVSRVHKTCAAAARTMGIFARQGGQRRHCSHLTRHNRT